MVASQELIVPIISFILAYIFLRRWRSMAAASMPQKMLPPSPMKLPIIGNLHQLGTHPHRSLHSLSKQYGQLMLLHFGKVPVVVASSADAAREIMKNQDLNFSNRPRLSIPDRFAYGSRDVAFAPYGEYWRQVRSICVLQLLSNKRVQSFRRVREEETSLMIEKIRKQGGSSSSIVNLSDVLVSLTNDVVCRVALGRKYGEDGVGRRFKKLLEEFIGLLGTFSVGDYVPWLAWINWINGMDGRVEKVAKLFDEFLESVLQEHRDQNKGDSDDGEWDFVDILLQFQRESKSDSSIEDEIIKALILDMFAAGTDTTVSVLEWTMSELIRNPRIMKILQNEVREVAESKQDIDEEDLEKMPYLKAVIKESLRLHVPLPLLLPRVSSQDTKLLGCDIMSNTHVMINAWAIARDPSSWENPDDFHPERFLDSTTDFRGLHFELIPFGAGRRGCPGIAFAMAVDELALAKLVHKFNFALPSGERVEDVDMAESTGIAVHRKFPLIVLTTPYSP